MVKIIRPILYSFLSSGWARVKLPLYICFALAGTNDSHQECGEAHDGHRRFY